MLPNSPVVDSATLDEFPEYVDWSDKTILIFERDYCSALLLKELLSSTHIRIVHINKKLMLENFYDDSIDLIIKGIDVEEMASGLKLTRDMRLRYPHIPIIAHSACFMNQENIEKCFDAGCDEFIGKPFKFCDFVDPLMKFLM